MIFAGPDFVNVHGDPGSNPTLGRFMSEDPTGFDAGNYDLFVTVTMIHRCFLRIRLRD
jgi:hypothetical protein